MKVSKEYPHFELPERVKNRLIKEVETADIQGNVKKSDETVPLENINTTTHFTFADTLKLASGREINVRELLESKKLQKSLSKEEAREVSELLVELEESLKSGMVYKETLEKGLNEMNNSRTRLVDGVLDKIVKDDGTSLTLEKEIKEQLEQNLVLDKEYHEALQKLDAQVSEVLGLEAKSLSSRQRNIERLQAAAGLDEVLKVVEGAGEKAIVAAQQGNEKLLALTENSLRNMVDELESLVDDGSKGADEIKEKLQSMQKEIEKAVAVWDEQAEELADTTLDAEAIRNMNNFIKTTRKKTLKGWSKRAKDANKELQESFKTPNYEKGAKVYADRAHSAVHSGKKSKIKIEVNETGERVIKRIETIFSERLSKMDGNLDVVNKDDSLINELQEMVREAHTPTELEEKLIDKVKNSNLFKSSSNEQVAEELHAVRDKIITEIETMVADAKKKIKENKGNFFKDMFTSLRDLKNKDNKIFHYWDTDKTKLPSYKRKSVDNNVAVKTLSVRVANREEIVARLANHEDVGKAQVEKGIEKLAGHLAAGATFVVIPVTSLRKKLSGHARVSAAKRWGALTGSYELTAEGRVDDMHTIIEGIAEATGAKVSDEVFYFMLRSGLRSKQ